MSEELSELLEMSRTAREFCQRFILSCFSHSQGRTVNELFWVPLILITRIVRGQEAIELLLEKGYSAEAAVIALTQFELRLDILYVGVEVGRATQWVEHESKRQHPWKVKDKIDDVYGLDPETKEAQLETFQMLSSVKHGNPLAGGFEFPVRIKGKKISGTTGEIDDSLALGYKVTMCGFCTYQLLEALEGASRAFSKFINIDDDLCEELAHFLRESKRKMARAMRRVGVIGGPAIY